MLLLTLAALASAVPADAPDTIVVTGVRLTDLRDAYEKCARDGCGARRDVVASVRYAEALFRSGKYEDSKAVLGRAVSRNKRRGAEDPIGISQLYLAQANVAAHYGDQRIQSTSTYASARVLRDTLGAANPETLLADLRVADNFVRDGDFRSADLAYVAVARRAAAADQPTIAASADIRRAWLLHQRKRSGEALALLGRLAALPGDAERGTRLAARVIAAGIARERGDAAATATLLTALTAEPQSGAPTLLWEPPLPRPVDGGALDQFERPNTDYRSSDTLPVRWVDIGFWVTPEGRVETPEVLRGTRDPVWAGPIVATIAARRYTPFAATPGAPGSYRIERFTLTAAFDVPKGSLIRRRIAAPRYERLDLTETPREPPAG